jgi:hypothetical protein
MSTQEIEKYGEIQYLKGRLDELYKSYTPGKSTHNNRVVDARISKYENKLKNIDEVAFHLYQVERKNIRISKQKSKQLMEQLFNEILYHVKDELVVEKIEEQIKRYE